MAEAMIITPVVEEAVGFVCSHTYQEIQYLWKFKSNIQKLLIEMTSLEAKKEAISMRIAEAKNNAEMMGPDVEEWLQKVEFMKKEADEIIQGSTNAHIGCFFNCKCPNMKVRYPLGKKAAMKTIEIADLLGKGEFSRVGYPAQTGEMPFTSPQDVVGFESRRVVEEHVMKALLDEEIHAIALCGMGGVGKTTMVKKLADEVKKDKHFDEVVMAVVSQNYDPINVQQQLAENLGLKLKEETPHARAGLLHTRLMDQGKRILLIIDDLWEDIVLREIGIPSEDERKGLKVLLTSRFQRVCSKMDVEEIIEVGVLNEKEAWGLFKKHAIISDDGSDVLKKLAEYPRKVADKCQGLPLAIEIIGKTVKNYKDIPEWRDALLGLENSQVSDTLKDMHDKVYSSIEWSVNRLKSRQCRSLLLLCSLFPEDYEIEVEDLVRFAKGLQLFNDVEKMAETRDRMETFIHELTDCYLLIACDYNRVKLHDVVRDTCLRIASEGENVYLVSHSRLTEWPDIDTYESYTAISLNFHYLKELPSGLKFSRLQLLRLSLSNNKIIRMNIITSFLQAMEKLRVLNINQSQIELPSESLQTSLSLRTLNLHKCRLYGDLSALLSSLVKIEVLSVYSSRYEGKWPKEIAELRNLKSLDLRFPPGPSESFPAGILIRLKKLEELYLGDAKLEPHEVIFREIGSLSNLNTIEIAVSDSDALAVLVENLDVERLRRFSISSMYDEDNRKRSRFSISRLRSPYQFSTRLEVDDTDIGMLLKPKMKVLLSKVDERLQLTRVTGYINDFDKFFDGGIVFSGLKSLELVDCDMKYICNATDSHTRAGVFVDLKILKMDGAKQLEELCHGDIPPESFASLESVTLKSVPLLSCLWGPIQPPCLGNLTSLQIEGSKVITSIFLGSSVKCFAQLRVIKITKCPLLESLVSRDAQTEKDTVEDKVVFPNLEELHLHNVDSFKTFYSEPEAPKVLLCTTT